MLSFNTQGHVVMGTQNVSPYQQVIEKTKNLIHRNQMLAVSLEKKEAQLKQLNTAQQVTLIPVTA